MSKHINPAHFYHLPSGAKVHPCRLIQKDGTLMWKHALLYNNSPLLPECEAHEQHIIKTAQRLEELNSWVSQVSDLTDFLSPIRWYQPTEPQLSEGISVHFNHTTLGCNDVYDALCQHVLAHETLELHHGYLHFRRC
jgi:hypothetical protein